MSRHFLLCSSSTIDNIVQNQRPRRTQCSKERLLFAPVRRWPRTTGSLHFGRRKLSCPARLLQMRDMNTGRLLFVCREHETLQNSGPSQTLRGSICTALFADVPRQAFFHRGKGYSKNLSGCRRRLLGSAGVGEKRVLCAAILEVPPGAERPDPTLRAP